MKHIITITEINEHPDGRTPETESVVYQQVVKGTLNVQELIRSIGIWIATIGKIS